jgi:hypothetical protein
MLAISLAPRLAWLPVAALFACGGTTSAETPDGGSTDSGVCSTLTKSGVAEEQCLGASCCSQLTACALNKEGALYSNCVEGCLIDGGTFLPDGGGSCPTDCASGNPQGANVCSPYYDCALANCLPVGG